MQSENVNGDEAQVELAPGGPVDTTNVVDTSVVLPDTGLAIGAITWTPSPAEVALMKMRECMAAAANLPPSRHQSIVITKLEEAQMWLERGYQS
jgi:hypothetical protein